MPPNRSDTTAPGSNRSTNKAGKRKPHWKQAKDKEETDEFWHPSLSTTPPDNFTPGLVRFLKSALETSRAKGETKGATLCWEGATYVTAQPWDRGWGCGYRNFLMACACLVEQQDQPMYFPLLDAPIPPSVRNLQKWIEAAWVDGYDTSGAAHFKNAIIGTKKWIGVTDLWIAFAHRGIPCDVVDFDYGTSFGGNEALLRWIRSYFSAGSSSSTEPIRTTSKMPFILQDGLHSRTIVGIEQLDDDAMNLLVFDPSRTFKPKIRKAALAQDLQEVPLKDMLGFFRFHIHRNVFGKQWQILHFPLTEPLTDYQRGDRKVVRTTRA
ncbi:DUF1671-domain-containing protein [Cylindrobasidium torrendii FP15055 ss-10]|uniref:DUF1671-domain-containing protein n=1 Tax=Cylindrobasidium torrendii FP15055 ss-10 TaxID=1314674 RepID=A0A0D7B329_9AGAR|nr:DUF1671-domain-containing protein [Cylindrobasidium torrendii FP15055 ss-10]